jgi:asparagine synthase (glutamine-hydrolysing)
MAALIALIDKKGKDATEPAVNMLSALSSVSPEAFGIGSASQVKIERTTDALRKMDLKSPTVIGYRFSGILHSDRPQPILLEDAAIVFDGRIYRPAGPPKLQTLVSKPEEKTEEKIKIFIQKSSGDYAFALAAAGRLFAGRDPVGARPLYYGENARFVALASERKALWRIGIDKAYSFPPGHVAVIDKNGFKHEPAKTLTYSEPKPISMQAAAEKLEALLRNSTAQRVSALKEAAIAFSGGLDSSIIASLARESKLNVQLIHVSLEDQKETEHAKKVAEILKLPIHTRLLKQEDVEEVLPKVLWLIEEADPVKTSIGIPIYWAAEQAAEIGFKVMLAGQGADELFGGYRRYVDDYSLLGEEEVRKRMVRDIEGICETNLERDFKICNFHDVELRLPFATFEIAKFALDLPVKLKIDPRQDSPRKLVLRKTAENMGLPQCVVQKPKKAMQYTTGIDKAIRRLAKRHGLALRDFLDRIFQKESERTV